MIPRLGDNFSFLFKSLLNLGRVLEQKKPRMNLGDRLQTCWTNLPINFNKKWIITDYWCLPGEWSYLTILRNWYFSLFNRGMEQYNSTVHTMGVHNEL